MGAEDTSIGKVGDTIVQGAYIVTLLNVERGEVYGEWGQLEEGNINVAVEILIESGADEGVSVNPFYCSLKDTEGYEYSMALFGKDPSLGSENDLPKGDKARGWVTFEVPETATGLIFILNRQASQRISEYDLSLASDSRRVIDSP